MCLIAGLETKVSGANFTSYKCSYIALLVTPVAAIFISDAAAISIDADTC